MEITLNQAWANRRSPTVWQSIANIFHSKKLIKIEGCLSIYGRSYLIYLIIGTQIGENFTVERSKLCFKIIIGKFFFKNHFNRIVL